eukprot:gene8464-4908_t
MAQPKSRMPEISLTQKRKTAGEGAAWRHPHISGKQAARSGRYIVGIALGSVAVHWTKKLIRKMHFIRSIVSPVLVLAPTFIVGPMVGASAVYACEMDDPLAVCHKASEAFLTQLAAVKEIELDPLDFSRAIFIHVISSVHVDNTVTSRKSSLIKSVRLQGQGQGGRAQGGGRKVATQAATSRHKRP